LKKPKPPSPPLSSLQRFQKEAKEAASKVGVKIGVTASATAEQLRTFDKRLNITKRAEEAGKQVGDKFRTLDERHGLTTQSSKLGTKIADFVQKSGQSVKEADDRAGITKALRENVLNPVGNLKDEMVSSEAFKTVSLSSEDAYGKLRTGVKTLFDPALPTYDCEELLQATEAELNYIAACVMQISPSESKALGAQFSRMVFAKASGAAAVSGILALIAAFGTSGTGAAIAGLHGAAATSATLAWVGGLVGGGMAAGAVLTGGVAMIVGLAAYKILASDRRSFESLSQLELWVVQSCWALAALCEEYRKLPGALNANAATQLLEGALRPLFKNLRDNLEELCDPLDVKNAIALRKHALTDFSSAVLERLALYVSWLHSEQGQAWLTEMTRIRMVSVGSSVTDASARNAAQDENDEASSIDLRAMYAIGGVFAALLSNEPLDHSVESRIVLEAIRRSSSQLREASEHEIRDFLRGLNVEQQRGFAANVKGIYHELSYVREYNESHIDTFARIHEATNYPGSDIQICDRETGEVLKEIQMKAVASSGPVADHLERYPDIDVKVTREVWANCDDPRVSDSGFGNQELHDDVRNVHQDLHDHTIGNRTGDSALFAMGIATVDEVIQMMRGERQFPEAVINAATKVGLAAGATAMAALLFG
jgi:hypothetical protein